MTDKIDISIGKSAETEDEQSGSGSGSSGAGRRSPISVSEEYGTAFYGVRTECEKCGSRAVGVIIIPEEILPEDSVCRSHPLCGKHRDLAREEFSSVWESSEFRRFVDA